MLPELVWLEIMLPYLLQLKCTELSQNIAISSDLDHHSGSPAKAVNHYGMNIYHERLRLCEYMKTSGIVVG